MPDKTWSDWVVFGGNILLVIVGAGGVIVAVCTLRHIENQTVAIKKQAEHMVESERPFLMIEVRGDANSVTFRIWNRGKSPAKILYLDKFLMPEILPIGEKLPVIPEYGPAYENAKAGAELVNPDWIAPGENLYVGSYCAKGELAMIPENDRSVRQGSHLLWIYNAILYKGLFSEKTYESRYCYRLGNGSWHMLGPYGYNEYT